MPILTDPIVLTLVGPRFSANDRLHFRVERALKQTWRELGQVHARAVIGPRLVDGFVPLQRAHVVVTQIPGSRRRTDPGNVAPAAKAAVDGIVLAGLLVDDDAGHMIGPDFRLGEARRQQPGMWTLEISVTGT